MKHKYLPPVLFTMPEEIAKSGFFYTLPSLPFCLGYEFTVIYGQELSAINIDAAAYTSSCITPNHTSYCM
jgi:hypothetical protein